MSFIDPLSPRSQIAENSRPIFAIQADLRHDEEIDRIVEVVLARYGRIDLLINAAAHYVFAPYYSDRLWRSVDSQFRINTIAPFRLAAVVARDFWHRRDIDNRKENRSIINVSSISGVEVFAGQHQSIYAATKAALIHLSAHMAQDFASCGIRVNAIAPNSFPSIVAVSDVVAAILQAANGKMTGQTFIVDASRERSP